MLPSTSRPSPQPSGCLNAGSRHPTQQVFHFAPLVRGDPGAGLRKGVPEDLGSEPGGHHQVPRPGTIPEAAMHRGKAGVPMDAGGAGREVRLPLAARSPTCLPQKPAVPWAVERSFPEEAELGRLLEIWGAGTVLGHLEVTKGQAPGRTFCAGGWVHYFQSSLWANKGPYSQRCCEGYIEGAGLEMQQVSRCV